MLELGLFFSVIAAIAPLFGAMALAKTAMLVAVVCLTIWAVAGLLAFAFLGAGPRRVLRHA